MSASLCCSPSYLLGCHAYNRFAGAIQQPVAVKDQQGVTGRLGTSRRPYNICCRVSKLPLPIQPKAVAAGHLPVGDTPYDTRPRACSVKAVHATPLDGSGSRQDSGNLGFHRPVSDGGNGGCDDGARGGGGGGRPRESGRGGGDRDDGSDPRYPFLLALSSTVRKLLAAAAVASVLATILLATSPAYAAVAAATGPNHGSTGPSAAPRPDGDVTTTNGSSDVKGGQPNENPQTQPEAEGSQDIQRLKRLLREVFAELTDLRARLDAADAEAADAAATAAEAWVVPLEGLSVRPYSRTLAAGLRLRCRAQVSGNVDTSAVVPVLASEQCDTVDTHMAGATAADEAVAAAGSAGAAAASAAATALPGAPSDWAGMMRAAGLRAAGAPRLRLRIQSVWGTEVGEGAAASTAAAEQAAAGAAGVGGVTGGPEARTIGAGSGGGAGVEGGQERGRGWRLGVAPGEGEQGEAEPVPVAAHLQLETGPDGRSLVVDKLLLKAEAHPRLKLLLATRGSLENIAMNVNPFAGAGELQRGLTHATRRGHDLTLLSQGGMGAAAAVKTGNMSAALGAFVGADGTAGCDPYAPVDTTTSGYSTTMTCGQISFHRSRRFVLTGACSSSTSTAAASSLAPAVTHGPMVGSVGAGEGDGGERREVQRGLIGAMLLSDRLSASAWVGDSVTSAVPCTPYGTSVVAGVSGRTGSASSADGCGPLGPWADAQCTSAPGAGALQGPGQGGGTAALLALRRQRRMGLRLATLPDEETGRSYALSMSHRKWMPAGGGSGGGGGEGSSNGLLVAEASATLPVAHGVVVTPGLVLLVNQVGGSRAGSLQDSSVVGGGVLAGGGRRTMLCATAQTTWSF